jgi:hypothetical protein
LQDILQSDMEMQYQKVLDMEDEIIYNRRRSGLSCPFWCFSPNAWRGKSDKFFANTYLPRQAAINNFMCLAWWLKGRSSLAAQHAASKKKTVLLRQAGLI